MSSIVSHCASSSNSPGLPGLGMHSAKANSYRGSLDQQLKYNKAANGKKTGEWELQQLYQHARPTKELMCALISSRPHQYRNNQYFFRFSSKNQLSQTN